MEEEPIYLRSLFLFVKKKGEDENMKKKQYEKRCPVCGKTFLCIGAEQNTTIRFCSKECSEKEKKAALDRIDQNAAEKFVIALIRTAVKDYLKAVKKGNEAVINEIEAFIFSGVFETMSGINPEYFYGLLLDVASEEEAM